MPLAVFVSPLFIVVLYQLNKDNDQNNNDEYGDDRADVHWVEDTARELNITRTSHITL